MAMRFEHEFSVPVPLEQAWAVLLDVESVAPCLPGASLESVDGNDFTGKMRVKVGPITVTYRGSAKLAEVDKDAYKVTIEGSGKEARGPGTATGTVRAQLHDAGDETRVSVRTTFNVTGRPAQFGRGVMVEVGTKLINRFAASLASQLADQHRTAAPAEDTAAEDAGGATPSQAAPDSHVTPAPPESDAAEIPEQAPEADDAAGADGASDEAAARHLSAVPAPRPAELDRFEHPAVQVRDSDTADDALDLIEVAGGPILRRVAPIAGAIALVVFLVVLIRRLTRRS